MQVRNENGPEMPGTFFIVLLVLGLMRCVL
jgi:hypothetical protein